MVNGFLLTGHIGFGWGFSGLVPGVLTEGEVVLWAIGCKLPLQCFLVGPGRLFDVNVWLWLEMGGYCMDESSLYCKWAYFTVEWWTIICKDLCQSSFHGEYVWKKGNHSGCPSNLVIMRNGCCSSNHWLRATVCHFTQRCQHLPLPWTLRHLHGWVGVK